MNEIVYVLAIGAYLIARGTLGEGGKEAYYSLKKSVQRFISPDDIKKLEEDGKSDARQAVVAEEIAKAGKADDPELLRLARVLAVEIKATVGAGGATGIDLENVEAIGLIVKGLTSTGDGIKVKGGKFTGDMRFSDIEAGGARPGK